MKVGSLLGEADFSGGPRRSSRAVCFGQVRSPLSLSAPSDDRLRPEAPEFGPLSLARFFLDCLRRAAILGRSIRFEEDWRIRLERRGRASGRSAND